MQNQKTGIIIALKIEADPFIGGLGFEKISDKPFPVYHSKNLCLAVSGMGQVRSALAASYIINTYKTQKLCNLGSAGAAGDMFKTGDILNIDSVMDYGSLRITKKPGIVKPCFLRGYRTASLATLDAPVTDPRERKEISAHADLIDMEGYGFAKACEIFNISAFLFKIVSDGPEDNDRDKIIRNIKKFSEKIFSFFKDEIVGKLS